MDIFVTKIDAFSGFVDPNFGNGDGNDNDGILQINDNIVTSASAQESVGQMIYESGSLYIAGNSGSNLNSSDGQFDTAFGGGTDIFVIKVSIFLGIRMGPSGDFMREVMMQ